MLPQIPNIESCDYIYTTHLANFFDRFILLKRKGRLLLTLHVKGEKKVWFSLLRVSM